MGFVVTGTLKYLDNIYNYAVFEILLLATIKPWFLLENH